MKKNNENISIIIPAYNEERTIGGVIKELQNNGYYNIIVINDGSSDATVEESTKHNAVVLSHIVNRGQGAALKTGVDYAVKIGSSIIVTFDADGQHQPADIKYLIQPIQNNKSDITLGSRFLNRKIVEIPFFKKIVLKIGCLFTYLHSGLFLSDTHMGLRAMSRSAAKRINFSEDGFSYASEIIDEIKKKNLIYREIPVSVKYTEYSMRKGQKLTNCCFIFFRVLLYKLGRM